MIGEPVINAAVLDQCKAWHGKIEVTSHVDIEGPEDLARVYTPGVAVPCKEIARDVDLSFDYTRRANLVAVVTDGSAVLGLGDIGPEAGMPVMEGKAALLKTLADVDAFPLCIRSKDVDEIVHTIQLLQGSFGAIHLEDIAAPRCFEIERKLKETLEIPVYHDDQHGTAVVAAAAMANACEVTGRDLDTAGIVIVGAGASGMAVAQLLLGMGATQITLVDKDGIVERDDDIVTPDTADTVDKTNPRDISGELAYAMSGADAIIGVAAGGIISADMARLMAPNPIVFALANPMPEIMPDEARGAAVTATGRSDFDNQVNNVLAFPGIFRGALDVRACEINDAMLLAATHALIELTREDGLAPNYIVPSALDRRVVERVAAAVADAAVATGVARLSAAEGH